MPTSLKQGNEKVHTKVDQHGRLDGAAPLPVPIPAAATTAGKKREKSTTRPLGNRPIRTKVALILVVPVTALLLFAGLHINESRLVAERAEDLNKLGKLSARVSTLTQELQVERGRIVPLLATGISPELIRLPEQIQRTDSAIAKFRSSASGLSLADDTEGVRTRINTVLDKLSQLGQLREGIKAHQLPTADAASRYTSIIGDLLLIIDGVAELAAAEDAVADNVRSLASFGHYEEAVSQEGTIVYEVLLSGAFGPGQYRSFVETLNAQEIWLAEFERVSPDDARELVDSKLSRSNLAPVLEMEGIALRAETADRIGISPKQWLDAIIQRGLLVAEVKIELADNVVESTADARDAAIQAALVEAAAVLLALVIAIAISLLIARSMVRPLVRLRTAALDVAFQRLPDVVRHLQEADAGKDNAIDVDTDMRALVTVNVTSSDEIGQVAQAFNAVHQEAVRVATEQARLRRNVAAMFVNLARRSQGLVERFLHTVDKMEQGENDPDRLAELFKLDHLANRMRRNDENLMVLAGADSGRRWNEDTELIDVLRAAVGEVEQYTRIKIGHVDEVKVLAAGVADVVHLVAELMENATAFSAPRTEVLVDARLVGGQVVIEIEDQGIGMGAEQLDELNERLSRPPTLDVNVSRMMGLFVVGRLANRHGVRVILRQSVGGGILAIVALPNDVLLDIPAITAMPELPTLPHPGELLPRRTPVPTPRGAEHSGEFANPLLEAAPTTTVDTTPPSAWRYQPTSGDSTLEVPLPIFEQVESEWFRPPTRVPADPMAEPAVGQQEAVPAPTPAPEPTVDPAAHLATAELPTAEQVRAYQPVEPLPRRAPRGDKAPERTTNRSDEPSNRKEEGSVPPSPEPAAAPSTSPRWESAADAGWQRAEELTDPVTGDTTRAGLPRRVPMANYVPGGVDNTTPEPPTHRSPDAVRGLLSSYRRGVEQGRAAAHAGGSDLPSAAPPVADSSTEQTVEEQ